MSNRENVIIALKKSKYCDDCLSNKTAIEPRQTVNKICRQLAKEGLISRHRATCPVCRDYKIVNRWLDTPSLNVPKPPPKSTITTGTAVSSKPWYWEGNVQQKIVDYLVKNGYQIDNTANTASREPGVDISTQKRGKRLLVTVKGYPQSSPNTQARHWFSQAIFDIILYRQQYPDADLAIGLPMGFATYNNLIPRVIWLKNTVPFFYFWVSEEGNVILKN